MKKRWMQMLLISLLLFSLAIGGCMEAAPDENGREEAPEAPQEGLPADDEKANGEDEAVDEEKAPEKNGEEVGPLELDLYFMEIKETSFELGVETREFPGPQVSANQLVEALLEGPHSAELSRALPEDVSLRDVTVEEGIAYVDFSRELAEVSLGHEAEAVLVNSIVWTLTQLEEVDAVQILIAGEIVETLAGHVLIDEPLH